MDEEDEDLIPPTSALYHYLKESGYVNLIDTEVSSELQKAPVIEDAVDVENTNKKSQLSFLHHFKQLFYPVTTLLAMSEEFRMEYYEMCKGSNLICDDDLNFLSSYLEEKLVVPPHVDWYPFAFGLGCAFTFSPILLRCLHKSFYATLMDVSLLSVGICILLVGGIRAYSIHSHKNLLSNSLAPLRNFIDFSANIANTLKGSIRLVQETEIISRGFTLGTVKDAITRIEDSLSNSFNNKFYQCLPLRKQIFKCANGLFMKMRYSLLNLIKLVPLSEDIDNIANYLAGISLSEFELKDGLDESDGKQKVLRVSNIKLVVERYHLQQSELLTRLILSHFPECTTRFSGNYSLCDTIKKHVFQTNSVLSTLQTVNAEALATMTQSHHFHKCFFDPADAMEKPLPSTTDGAVGKIQTYVRSVYLHLQAALARVRDLQLFLEQKEADGENSFDQKQQVIQSMEVIRNELNASSDCVDEGFFLFKQPSELSQHMTGNEINVITSKIDRPETFHPWKDDEIVIGDPRIEERVYEGVNERNEEEYRQFGDDELEEQMLKKKREAEDATKLYRELINVLKLRASETQLTEESALRDLKIDRLSTKMEQGDPVGDHNVNSTSLVSPSVKQGEDLHQSNSEKPFPVSNEKFDFTRVPESNLSFSANVAAMAAARSQSLGLKTLISEEILGDDSTDSD